VSNPEILFQNRFSACTDDLPNELTDETGQTVTDPSRIMDLLNEYFATIAENLKENLLHENFKQTHDTDYDLWFRSLYSDVSYDIIEIKSIIVGLKNDAASGLDDCSSKMLNNLSDDLSQFWFESSQQVNERWPVPYWL
jgi:hypothetical protein